MTVETSYIAAFLVGFLGGVHCVGMCGGIMSALTLGIQPVNTVPSNSQNISKLYPYLVSYNFARILSYTIAGLIFGGLGTWISDLILFNQAQMILKVIAGLFLIALGLYLANWWRGLSYVEQLGSHVWKFIEPTAKRFIPIKNLRQAFGAGFVWGWLPCGLVYSVLIWSLSSGSALEGGLLMLSFGLGTLPILLAVGLFAVSVKRFMQMQSVRVIAGALIVGFGLYQLVIVFPDF